MSFFGTQLERGYSWLVVVEIDGIPALWTEREALRFDTDTDPTDATNKPMEPALVVTESTIVQWTLDRMTGVAAGRALDIDLDLDRMSPTAREFFRRPGRRARLTADVLSGATTTIPVDDTSVWPSTGRFWLGHECCDYTGKTSTSFTGVTRAVAGLVHPHVSNSASGYASATDRPIYWRGRFVTVHLHLVTPDGRLMATTWLGGDYTRPVWRGFLDAQPEIRGRRVTLRALPLERRLSHGLGSEAKAEIVDMYSAGADQVGIWVETTDKLIVIKESNGDTAQVPFDSSGFASLTGWGAQAMEDARTYFGASFVGHVHVRSTGNGPFVPPMRFFVYLPAGYRVESRAWFVGTMSRDADSLNGFMGVVDFVTMPRPWLFLKVGLDVVGRPQAWPSSGFAIAECNGEQEVIAWDRVEFPYTGYAIIRISQREIAGTRKIDMWAQNGTVTTIAGDIGFIGDVSRRLLTSSGTGSRGPFDTLATGYGYGIPDAWLDFDGYPWSTQTVEALADAGETFEGLLGGWFALNQACLAQTYQFGSLRIRPVSTTVMDGAGLTELEESDVILGTVEAQGLVESPNAVTIDRSVLSSESSLSVRDVPRVQAEDWRVWEMSAPGISEQQAVGLSVDIMAISDGQQAVKVGVRPAYRAGLGELVRVTAEHPEIYDWGTGDTATSEIARVTDLEWSLHTGERSMVHLFPGQAQSLFPLCPSAEIFSRPSSTEIEIAIEDVVGFADGYGVRVYRAGDESSYFADRVISTVTFGTTTATLTLTVSLSTTDYPAGAYVTYVELGSGDPEQAAHLYYETGEFR